MSDLKTNDWREFLDPPPGGLLRLIDAIEAPVSRSAPRAWRWAAALLVAAIVAFLIGGYVAHTAPERRIRLALITAAQAPVDSGLRIERGAALEIPGGPSDVRFFWIAQLPAPDAAPGHD